MKLIRTMVVPAALFTPFLTFGEPTQILSPELGERLKTTCEYELDKELARQAQFIEQVLKVEEFGEMFLPLTKEENARLAAFRDEFQPLVEELERVKSSLSDDAYQALKTNLIVSQSEGMRDILGQIMVRAGSEGVDLGIIDRDNHGGHYDFENGRILLSLSYGNSLSLDLVSGQVYIHPSDLEERRGIIDNPADCIAVGADLTTEQKTLFQSQFVSGEGEVNLSEALSTPAR